MTTLGWLVLIVLALAIGAAAAWLVLRQRRRTHLTDRFGPEYERMVAKTEDRTEAEHELERRERRIEQLDIRPLDPDERLRFGEEWKRVQARFVDEPAAAVEEADELIRTVMQARGYPIGDFEQRAEDLSVDHPDVVQNYRAGHELAKRSREGTASTEDLRQAMKHHEALFDELLGEASRPAASARGARMDRRGWSRRSGEVRIERKG